MAVRLRAGFVEPMLLLRSDRLPEDASRWEYELKLDGYRAIAFKTSGVVRLRSRNDNDFDRRYPAVVEALSALPEDSIVDGEIVAFDDEGRPSFNTLQNYGAAAGIVVYFLFDVMMLAGRDVTREPLSTRRRLLETRILPRLTEPVRYAPPLDGDLPLLIASVKANRLEGLVAKRRDSRYEPGERSGAWLKMRVNQAQDFVIGGYTIGPRDFDALIFGYYEDGRLIYAARTRNGFTPSSRAQLFKRLRALEVHECPFVNLPEAKSGRWGQGLTAAKMKVCRWVKPVLVGQFEFLEWSGENHLRHTRFIGMHDHTDPRTVVRERRD